MAVLRIIPAGDLALERGDLVMIGLTAETRVAYIRQKLAARFKFFRGEWFRDTREGVPYFRDVLRKNPNLDLIRSMFARVVRETPGVLSVTSFALAYDAAARTCTFTFQARVDGGVIVVAPTDLPFIINLGEVANAA